MFNLLRSSRKAAAQSEQHQAFVALMIHVHISLWVAAFSEGTKVISMSPHGRQSLQPHAILVLVEVPPNVGFGHRHRENGLFPVRRRT